MASLETHQGGARCIPAMMKPKWADAPLDEIWILRFIKSVQVESFKVFCDLAETQSFTKAAQLNEVTQSAVSQLVAGLEKSFNGLLLERARGESKLTARGELVYEHSKEILGIFSELQAKLKETQRQISGTIRLATIFSVGLYELPSAIKQFLKSFLAVRKQKI